jgi:hypothetical protein
MTEYFMGDLEEGKETHHTTTYTYHHDWLNYCCEAIAKSAIILLSIVFSLSSFSFWISVDVQFYDKVP